MSKEAGSPVLGINQMRAYRNFNAAKSRIEILSNNPGRHEQTYLKTVWNTPPSTDQRHFELQADGSFAMPKFKDDSTETTIYKASDDESKLDQAAR